MSDMRVRAVAAVTGIGPLGPRSHPLTEHGSVRSNRRTPCVD